MYEKTSQKYASGECKFKSDCAYKHVESTEHKEQIKLEEKVKQLEKLVHHEEKKGFVEGIYFSVSGGDMT